MSDIPKSISRIYNQFDAVSPEHALVYSVIVRLTLMGLVEQYQHSHPDVATQLNDWVEQIKNR